MLTDSGSNHIVRVHVFKDAARFLPYIKTFYKSLKARG